VAEKLSGLVNPVSYKKPAGKSSTAGTLAINEKSKLLFCLTERLSLLASEDQEHRDERKEDRHEETDRSHLVVLLVAEVDHLQVVVEIINGLLGDLLRFGFAWLSITIPKSKRSQGLS